MANRFEGDLFVSGNLGCATFAPPAGSVPNTAIPAGAKIDADKLQHIQKGNYSQANVTAVTETKVIGVCRGVSGIITDFRCGSIVPCAGAATITLDLKRNGTTVLSAVVTLNNANTARISVPGTLTVTTLAAQDVLEVVVIATAGGGTIGTGLYAMATWKEDAQ